MPCAIAVLIIATISVIAGQSDIRGSPKNTMNLRNQFCSERQVTRKKCGHLLTNIGVWSPDGKWIAYDTRSAPAGDVFDGTTIERVHVETGEVQELYRSKNGAHCGVVTWHPKREMVAFILGPENPTPDWQYGFWHRQGVLVDEHRPGIALNMDACDVVPPFTPGALRGGSHVHIFSGDGDWISFTYEDHVLSRFTSPGEDHDMNLRNIGVSVSKMPVIVKKDHPRNFDGTWFTVLATRTISTPRPGSDDIKKAFDEAWIGNDGYVRADGTRQKKALAFQGHVVTAGGETITEVFIVDLPEDVTVPGDGPLEGTSMRAPYPPKGTKQRRLTHTADRKYPGLQGPRHWLRTSPDGSQIAFLMKDDDGIVQVFTISPNGGDIRQITHNSYNVDSAFTWSPDGRHICFIMDGSICATEVKTGLSVRLTQKDANQPELRPEACVFSPDGNRIAYVRQVAHEDACFNQIFILNFK